MIAEKNLISKIVLPLLRTTRVIFHSNLACRLIDLFKMQMGKISKVILQDIYAMLRIALNKSQWHCTNDCIK